MTRGARTAFDALAEIFDLKAAEAIPQRTGQ